MEKELREKLKKEGRSFRWFHKAYIPSSTGITYNALALQLNGYAKLSYITKKAIQEYLRADDR